jgi:hypothetical protein
MAAGENRSAVVQGKGKTMHETYGVEFATARPAPHVALHYAELSLLSAELRPVTRLPNTRKGATA